jgi:deoxycytidylate deaminase
MFAAGIKEVKYLADYHNDELVAILANQCGVTIEKLNNLSHIA